MKRNKDRPRLSMSERLAFSLPNTVRVHVMERGLLIERDMKKDISLPQAIGIKSLSRVRVGEPDARNAKVIARYVNK